MEKNKVARSKKAKAAKPPKAPKPPKQKKEKRSVTKQRKMYEKALKKARPEKMLSIIAIVLALFSTIMDRILGSRKKKQQ